MSTLPPVRIAVIGAGLIGKRHISHVLSEPETTLVALVEPFPIGASIAAEHDIPLFLSVSDLLAARAAGKTEVDAAIVGTPTGTHVKIGKELIEAGVFALVEKPVAGTQAEALELVEADEKSTHAKVLVGQHRRFNPYTVALKAALDSGKLGTLLGIQGTWSTRKGGNAYFTGWHTSAAQGGGTISINMIHDMDLLRYLMGEVESVYAVEGVRTRGFEVEETGGVVLRFRSGAVGTFFFSDAAASPYCFEGATGENPDLVGFYGKDIYTLHGTHGSISLPSLQLHTFSHLPPPAPSVTEGNDNWLSRLSVDNTYAELAKTLVDTPPFTLQLRHFVRLVRGEEGARCSAREGMESVGVVEGIKVSIEEKRLVML